MALDTIQVARAEIAQIYIAAFNRVPDAGGLSNWLNQYMAGLMTYAQIAENFTTQPEYTAKYPSIMTNTEYVTEIYNNVFGRDPDAGGLVNWVNQLDATSITGINRGNIMTYMLASAGAPGNIDGERLDNQAAFAVQSILDGVPEATATAQLANITSDVATVTAATTAVAGSVGGVNAQTFNLTTGVDSLSDFTGGSGADIFNANEVAAGKAFSALDKIDGSGGTDVLNINDTTATVGIPSAQVSNIETANVTSAVSIGVVTTFDTSSWTGLQTLNLESVGAIVAKAAATTDVNASESIAAVSIQGGKNVTVSHTTAGDVKIDSAAGAVVVTSAGNGDVKIGGNNLDTNAATNDMVLGSVTATVTGDATNNKGAVTIVGGTTINVTAAGAISSANRATHIATTATTAAAKTAATTADTEAGKVVTDLGTLKTAVVALATTDVVSALTAVTCDAIVPVTAATAVLTQAQKTNLDATFAATYAATTGVAAVKEAAAEAAVVAIIDTYIATATAAKNATATALITATATDTAAQAVIATGGATGTDKDAANSVAKVVVTATTNAALTSATVTGNYAAAANAITDGSALADKLTTVSLENAGAFTLTGKALLTVNLKDQASNVTIVNAATANALTVNMDKFAATLDVDNAGTADTTTLNLNVTGANTITALDAAKTTALNITGAGNLTSATALTQAAAIITATNATGNITTNVLAGQTYNGGSGVDTITLGAAGANALQTKAVDGGAGTADKIVVVDSDAVATTGAALIKNFEILEVNNQTVDVSKLTNSTITSLVASGAAVTFTAASIAQAANVTINSNGLTQALTVDVTGAATGIQTMSLTTVGNVDLQGDLTIAGVEKINLHTTLASGATSALVQIDDLQTVAALTNLVVDGAGALTLVTGSIALAANTVLDASAVTAAVTIDASLAEGTGFEISGSATKANTLKSTDVATQNAATTTTINGGSAADTITGGQYNDIINAGEGNNIIITDTDATGAVAAATVTNTVTAGNGNNTVTGGQGADTITLGNGYNIVNAGAGNDTISVGTGGVCEILANGTVGITGGAGNDAITFAAHAAGVFNIVNQGLGDSTASSAQTLAGVAVAAGDVITFANGVDKITGFDASKGDMINFTSTALVSLIGETAAGLTADKVMYASGTWDATAKTFTISANGVGADTLILDSDNTSAADAVLSTNDNMIVLIGVDSDTFTTATFI